MAKRIKPIGGGKWCWTENCATHNSSSLTKDPLTGFSTNQEYFNQLVNKDENIAEIISKVEDFFVERRVELAKIYEREGQGGARYAAGELYEDMIDLIVNNLPESGLASKRGTSDFLSTNYYHPKYGKVAEQHNLQVDRHLWKNGKRFAFIEAKTYLDKPYLARASSDFIEIKRSLDLANEPTSNLKFIVFAGQNSININSQRVQEAKFWTISGDEDKKRTDMEIFFVTNKKRTSSKPIYDPLSEFTLNESALKAFIKTLLDDK